MNSFSDRLIKDDVEMALDFMVPSTVPQAIVPVFKKMLRANISDQEIIDNANRLIVTQVFSEEYFDFIAKALAYAGETASFIEFDPKPLALTKSIDDAVNGKSANLVNNSIGSFYLWLHLDRIKNKKLYKFFFEYLTGTTRYLAKERKSCYIQILPATNFEVLDEISRALSSYI